MDRGFVSIIFHHNGSFSTEGSSYDGGKISIIRNVDKDLMSYFHVLELAKQVGFKDGDSMYYAIPGCSLENGLDLLKDDASVYEMLKYANETNFLEVYIQHNQYAVDGNPKIGEAIQRDKTDEMARLQTNRAILLLGHEMRRRRLKILITMHVLLLHWMKLIRKHQYRMVREPCRFDPASRSKKLNDMIYESDILCVDQLRMDRRCFWTLCSLVTEIGGLRATRNVSVEEMVAMFLHVLAHGEKSRSMRIDFQRSQETISRHFNNVLAAVLKLSRVLLKTPQPIPENYKGGRWKWFKNCLGALDGTYIKVRVPVADKPRYRSRKNDISTNVLGACAPDMQFTYVLAGWEGSAADARVLRDALCRPRFLVELFNMKHSYPIEPELEVIKKRVGKKRLKQKKRDKRIEKELAKKLPNAQLKADPHIQSKVKLLKKQLSYILDIQQYGSGFGWDDSRKMVVGNEKIFKGWARSRPGAPALYGKPFPHYDKLCEIYASDLANGAAAKGPADQLDSNGEHSTINLNEPPNEDADDSQSETPHVSSNPSNGTRPRGGRKRSFFEDEIWDTSFASVSNSLQNLVEVEKENAAVMKDIKTALVHEVEVQKQIDAQSKQLFAAISRLPGFTDDEIVKAACIIAKDVPTLNLFFSTPDDKKCAFVRHVIGGGGS
ncbi:hypothetical protein ACP70R_001138 [Stipagrostis hirtigluma subsp. patula]